MSTKTAMKISIALFLTGSILFLQSCASTEIPKTAAVPSRDQKVGYEDTITSQKKHFVSLSPYTKLDLAKDKTLFMLTIRNNGKVPINVTNNIISMTFEETAKKGASKKINIQALDEFINDLENESFGQEKHLMETSLERIKYKVEYDSPTTEELDELFEDLKTDVETSRLTNETLRETMPEFFMKPQTIMPGNNCTGIVVFDTRDLGSQVEGNYKIVVLIDNEEHKFTFNRGLNK
jgi:hypothetical protein